MYFETLQRVLGKEAEPDWVQSQSFVFVHSVLFHVEVQSFLDSPLHAVTFAIYDFQIVEIKSMLFENVMLNRSRHVKLFNFDVGRVLPDAYAGCASCFSNVWLFTVTTLETIYNTWVIISTAPIFQLLLERALPVLLAFQLLLHSEASRFSAGAWLLHQQNFNGTNTVVCRRCSLASASRNRTDSSVFRCLIRVRRLPMKRAG